MKLHDYVAWYARSDGTRLSAIQGDRELSFADLERYSAQLAHGLNARGVSTGQRIGLLSRNSIEMVIVYVACSRSGIVPVPINWRLTSHEVGGILDDAGAQLLLAQSDFAEQLSADGLAIPIIDLGPEGDVEYGPLYSWLAEFSARYRAVEQGDEGVLYQMYTSGTTGFPKGALLSHAGVNANTQQNMVLLNHCFGKGKRCLLVMPMFHAGAASTVIGCINSGTTMVIHAAFEPQAFIDSVHNQGVTIINSVPAMLQAILQLPGIRELKFPQLQTVIYGASPIAADTLKAAIDVFQCEFFQGYGQTESSAVISFLDHADHLKALNGREDLLLSAGRAIVGTELKVIDADGQTLPPGETGEILARGPQVMLGYWQREEATAATLAGGWLHTGDMGYLDKEGYLFIQDRLKDMIVSGGENIYPRELENCLMDHPSVADAAVIGIPDEKYGETPLALIVPVAGTAPTEQEISAHCRQYLAGFKLPRQVKIVEQLPRNPSGKILKKELREPYWSDTERHVS